LGYRFIDQAQSPSFDLFKMNNFAADEVQKIMNVASVKKVIDNVELAQELKRNIEMADQMQGVTGVPTGFSEYDMLTGGHKPTNFIVMAARPGMGKTALALCMMLNAVVKFGKKVMFFTREMPAIELFQRLCCIHMNIDSDRFKRGNLDQKEWDHFNSNLQALLSKDIVIVDDCKTMQEIHLRAKKERMNGEVHEIIIDYLQLVNGPEKKREELISGVSRACKEMATDLCLPVIALSQLNRSVESRGGDKRPQLSDLRESGAIEQDADMVIFVYRPPYYGDTSHGDNAAFICIAKHRSGKLQDVPLKFIPELTKFIDTDQTSLAF
jgi:replicative DNA helicase